jgi:hypothetical protein
MTFRFSAVINERKKELLMRKYSVGPEVLDQADEIDPPSNYTDWLVKQIKAKNIKIPEDVEKIRGLLEKFTRLKNSQFKESHSTDIGSYTPNSLFKALDEFGDSKKQEKRNVHEGINGSEIKYKEDPWIVYRVTTPQAAVVLGSNTNWCTAASTKTAASYLKDGPLWIFYRDGKPYAQLHPDSGQFCDRGDRSFRDGYHLKNNQVYDLVHEIRDKTKDPEMVDYCERILPYVEPSDKYLKILGTKSVVMIASVLERIMIRRYPELEPKVFDAQVMDKENLIRGWFEDFGPRDPNVEAAIVNKGMWAAGYALYVIGAAWPEAERAIKKTSSNLRAQYIDQFQKDIPIKTLSEMEVMLKAGKIKKRQLLIEPKMFQNWFIIPITDKDYVDWGANTKLDKIGQYCKQAGYVWPEVLDKCLEIRKQKAAKGMIDALIEVATSRNVRDERLMDYAQNKINCVPYLRKMNGPTWVTPKITLQSVNPLDYPGQEYESYIAKDLDLLIQKKVHIGDILSVINHFKGNRIKDFDKLVPLIRGTKKVFDFVSGYLNDSDEFYPELFDDADMFDPIQFSTEYLKKHLLGYAPKFDLAKQQYEEEKYRLIYNEAYDGLRESEKLHLLNYVDPSDDGYKLWLSRLDPFSNQFNFKPIPSKYENNAAEIVIPGIHWLATYKIRWPKLDQWLKKHPEIVNFQCGSYRLWEGLSDISGYIKTYVKLFPIGS